MMTQPILPTVTRGENLTSRFSWLASQRAAGIATATAKLDGEVRLEKRPSKITYSDRGKYTTLLPFFLLFLCCLFAADAGAQRFSRARTSTFRQQVPPFLKDKPAATSAVVEGEVRPIPRFSAGINPKVYSPLMIQQPSLGFYRSPMVTLFPPAVVLTHPYLENFDDAPNHLPYLQGLRGPNARARFNFREALPHLAFFCRMEINEARGNIIPARFRLGGHRYWQDNLLRRR